MASYVILANQSGFSTTNGDYIYVAQGVTVGGGIDMRGYGDADPNTMGGDQIVSIMGNVTAINDYFTDTSGGDDIYIGPDGSIVGTYSVIQIGGGGNRIVNDGSIISSAGWGYAIYVIDNGGHDGERQYLVNNGMISASNTRSAPNASDSAIVMSSAGGVSLTNTGTIRSVEGYALYLGGAGTTVVNSGRIDGESNIYGDGSSFDSRGGVAHGAINMWGLNTTVYGGTADDVITTSYGNDYLNGYHGADTMVGGGGDDTYVIDNAGDAVDESTGSGTDTVLSFISLDMTDSDMFKGLFELVKLAGSDSINASGDGSDNIIYGNVAANVIEGDGGNDTLVGRGGSDTLRGGDGNDKLNGGAGADVMAGGNGNDTYTVQSAFDVVDERNGSGTDTVLSSVSFVLGGAQAKGSVENLTLIGGAASAGTGNGLNNVIVGNGAANDLNGLSGNDRLTGGGGGDHFIFSTGLSASKNLDVVTDFVHGTDKIELDNHVFSALGAAGVLGPGRFALNAAADGNDNIIYNTTTGVLSYDADGNGAGAAVAFAKLLGLPGLTSSDFLVI